MEAFLKDFMLMIKNMEKEFLDLLMEIFMKVNLRMDYLMDKANISFMLREIIMKGNSEGDMLREKVKFFCSLETF